MTRNGWILPSLKSTIMTAGYLRSVRKAPPDGFWCPHQFSAKHRNCADVPNKQTLLDELERLADAKGVKTGLTKTKTGDVQWLLIAIASLNESARFFKKGYAAVGAEKRYRRGNQIKVKVSNSDNLFSQIVPVAKKRGQRLRKTLTLTREEA